MPLCVIINTIWRFVCDVAWLLKPKCSTFYLKDLLFISSLINREVLLPLCIINTIWRLVCDVAWLLKPKCSMCFYLKDFRISGSMAAIHRGWTDGCVTGQPETDRQMHGCIGGCTTGQTDRLTNLPHSFTDSVRALQDRGLYVMLHGF